jgi:protein TonB
MSNVSIYEKNWIDLVFEDKNKAYGAYQLRQENSRTTLFAFLGSLTLILVLLGGWFLFSSFGSKPEPTIINCPVSPTITPVKLKPRVEPTKPMNQNIQVKTASPNKFKKYVASTTPVEIEVPVTATIPMTSNTSGNGTEAGSTVSTSTGGESPTLTTTTPTTVGSEPVLSGTLDRLPEYPGGINKFYEYVGNNIEKPEIDEHLSMISVIMSFVIEKDGTMSNIKVLRSTDKNLEREAIRVLRSLKVKWAPGYKDGEKMRTLYTLPIKVAL